MISRPRPGRTTGNANFWLIYQRYFGSPYATPQLRPVYAFRKISNGTFLYTTSVAERVELLTGARSKYWTYKGASFAIDTSATAGSVPVYRFYNRKTGKYSFTTSKALYDERRSSTGSTTWAYQGTAFKISKQRPVGLDADLPVQAQGDGCTLAHRFSDDDRSLPGGTGGAQGLGLRRRRLLAPARAADSLEAARLGGRLSALGRARLGGAARAGSACRGICGAECDVMRYAMPGHLPVLSPATAVVRDSDRHGLVALVAENVRCERDGDRGCDAQHRFGSAARGASGHARAGVALTTRDRRGRSLTATVASAVRLVHPHAHLRARGLPRRLDREALLRARQHA